MKAEGRKAATPESKATLSFNFRLSVLPLLPLDTILCVATLVFTGRMRYVGELASALSKHLSEPKQALLWWALSRGLPHTHPWEDLHCAQMSSVKPSSHQPGCWPLNTCPMLLPNAKPPANPSWDGVYSAVQSYGYCCSSRQGHLKSCSTLQQPCLSHGEQTSCWRLTDGRIDPVLVHGLCYPNTVLSLDSM